MKQRLWIIAAATTLFVVGATLTASAQGLPRATPEDVGMSSDRLARIRPAMQRYVDAGTLPGVITAVARRGKLAYFDRVGMMDVEEGKAMREDTIFRMASMTKPMTGVAVMILYEEGRFLLTDPVSKYLPEFAGLEVWVGGTAANPQTEPAAREMTVEDLLTHMSGLIYGGNDTPVGELYGQAQLFAAPSLASFIERVASVPLAHQPGSKWFYSISQDVLGGLVEVLSGQPFDEFLAERVFEPLGMSDTAFYVPESKADRLAASYRATPERGMERAPSRPGIHDADRVPYGGAGSVSTAADYLRFAQMLANSGELDGVRILGRKTVDLMMMNHLDPALGPEPMAEMASSLQAGPRGVGYGLTGAVITDVAQSALPGSVGAFSWGGARSTYFWVDRAEELVGLLLTQVSPSDRYPLRAEIRILTYQALTE
ncbi:MAG TPA: serine hydrolase domain-containing protein [Acidobacteriota bacterium]|nr:serine hydrolase domain-containing protein [Acidobacteriota bacterium]